MSSEHRPRLRPRGKPEAGALLWRFGHQVRANDEQWRRETGWRPENLRKPGLAPVTIIDVGAGPGTSGFYAAFPDAYLVAIDPLSEFEAPLRKQLERREAGGEYVCTAAGSENTVVTMYVDRERLTSSSIEPKAGSTPELLALLEERTVPVVMLDELFQKKQWKPPFGLKIDTEGFEYEVIKGAGTLLEQTQFVIAEVSLRERFERSYTFAEFIELMGSLGFALRDILDGHKTAVGGEVLFIDAFFQPERRTS
jgi:FkbM family methyltransferase